MSAAPLDPITFEVIKNALSSIADEMALIVMRSAYSPVVRDTMDYSTALCDRRGQLIAQGLTLAVQLGSFPDSMRILLADHAPTAKPGDIFLYNDPYGSGGQHLPDIYIVKPIFHDGVIEGWACTMAHHCDVGGIAAGSTAIHATEIFQEGICLPIVKLHEAGVPNEMLLRILEKNTRMPVQLIGDIRAQLAACAAGERGYRQLLAKYGAADLRRYLDALQDQAERLMRDVIVRDSGRPLPRSKTGSTASARIRSRSRSPSRSRSRATASRSISPAPRRRCAAAVNCPIAMVNSSTYCAIRCLTDREIPNCEGYMRPVQADRAARNDPQSRASGGLRGARRHGLSGVRRDHGRAGAGRAGARDCGVRRRPDPVLDRRAAERAAIRAHRSDGRHLGRARRSRRHRGHLQSGRQPVEQSGRADRGGAAASGHRVQLRHGLRRSRPAARRACIQPHLSGCSPTRRSAPCAPTAATTRPTALAAANRAGRP